MGSKNSKRPKTLEQYNSFEVLPTSNDFYNQQLIQQQQLLSQHSTTSLGQQFQPSTSYFGNSTMSNHYSSNMMPHLATPQSPQGMFFGFQTPARLSLPPYGAMSQQISPYGPRLQVGYMGQSHHSLSLGRHANTISRRQYGMYPSSPQIVQSVPKFNQGPIVKF